MNIPRNSCNPRNFLAVFCFLASPLTANKFEYFFYEDEGATITITDCESSVVSASIPPFIIGKPFTRIGTTAFASCKDLVNVSIPPSVSAIGESAFLSCSSLRSISILNGVTSIEGFTFQHCSSLTSVNKNAFNMNAGGPDTSVLGTGGSSGLPLISIDQSGALPVLKFEFLRRNNSGLIYTPERATSLDRFTSMEGTQTVTPINAEWERVTITENNPAPTEIRGFARSRVTLP